MLLLGKVAKVEASYSVCVPLHHQTHNNSNITSHNLFTTAIVSTIDRSHSRSYDLFLNSFRTIALFELMLMPAI